MIIRSGIIRKTDKLSSSEFTSHWRDVHGPLALKVRGMLAYSQNHISEAEPHLQSGVMHRVDGISQLYFSDIAEMKAAMESQEQQACIEDIHGFLSDVTLCIQARGEKQIFGPAQGILYKVMFLMQGGRTDVEHFVETLVAWCQERQVGGIVRLNPVVDRGFIVDKTVPSNGQIIDAVVELWITRRDTLWEDLVLLVGFQERVTCHALLAVEEFVMSQLSEDPLVPFQPPRLA